MKILQISFHTAPFGSAGKYDSGGLNIYVEKISDQLSKNNFVTVLTAEKAKNFVKGNLEFKSLNLFDKDLSVDDKEIYLQEFINKLYESVDLESFDVIHTHYWLSGLVGKEIAINLINHLFTLLIVWEFFLMGTTKKELIVKNNYDLFRCYYNIFFIRRRYDFKKL